MLSSIYLGLQTLHDIDELLHLYAAAASCADSNGVRVR